MEERLCRTQGHGDGSIAYSDSLRSVIALPPVRTDKGNRQRRDHGIFTIWPPTCARLSSLGVFVVCDRPLRQDILFLSSTYLSQGAVRPLTQDAWGRAAPPLESFLQPRIVAVQGQGPQCRTTHWGAHAGGTRFGIAVLPL